MNVLAGLHSFDDLPFELHSVTTPLCLLRHCSHSIRCKSASFRSVSLLGFSPLIGVHLRPIVAVRTVESHRSGNTRLPSEYRSAPQPQSSFHPPARALLFRTQSPAECLRSSSSRNP